MSDTTVPYKTLIAWSAGFIDGDGCFSIYKFRSSYQIKITASQRRKSPLIILKKLYGGSIWREKRNKSVFVWQISAIKAHVAINKMFPYLIVKRKEAKTVLAFREEYLLKNLKKEKFTTEEIEVYKAKLIKARL